MTDTTDDYGYLLVHFIEDPDGYAEKIYMDISDGDNPHRWVPLNDGKPVLASHLGTTGVRDPHIIRNPDTGTWYIIATDLRVFGGDGGGWYEWSHHASTNLIIWESDDLLHWSEPRMLDVSRKPDGSHLELGMAWACECLWVPDYYPQGHHGGRGAFVMYWSSTVFNDADKAHDDKNVYCTVLWGATTDFTQDTFEYGWTVPTRSAGGSRGRSGPRCRTGLAQATCRTATPAAWKVLRCSPTTTTTVDRTTNGTCSWT